MGTTVSKDFTQFQNACEARDCIKTVHGLKPNSTSPSEQWILDLEEGVTYEGVKIEKAFLKFWVSSRVYENMAIQALDYELWVYRYAIRRLVDLNICPNFVRFLVL